jgi:GWxTD domain-containing protein
MIGRCIRIGGLALLVLPLGFAQNKEPQLPKKYETWIKEEVAYIISPTENDVFSKLESDRERDMFIEEFWKQRDPTPGTPRNEFKDEHYRRIAFANLRFGPGSGAKGWRTDRGRIYIKLGPPFDVQRYQSANTYPMELWYYQGNPRLGQASMLRLLFFQQFGAGDYKLYHPVTDGPKSLLPDPYQKSEIKGVIRTTGDAGGGGRLPRALPSEWDEADRNAYLLLSEYGFDEFAEATFSLIPGSRDFRQIMASTVLLGDVEAYPQKKVKDDYALDFLTHKATVEVSYSVYHINNRSRFHILQNASGAFVLNYVIVPENLTLENYQDTYFADLKTDIRLSDEQGRTIYQGEKYVPIELTRPELAAVKASAFQLYDALPVIPGRYKLNLLLENTVSKEFTTVEKDISVPDGESLGLGPIILARKVNRGGSPTAAAQAFQVGALQIYPSVNNAFEKKDRIFVFFQVYGASPVLLEEGLFECSVTTDGAAVLRTPRRRLAEAEGGRDLLEEFGAESLTPGTHVLRAAVFDKSGRELLFGETPFLISETPVPGAWVAAQASPPPDDAQTLYLLGTQYLSRGEIDRAGGKLEKAYAAKPESRDFALGYARVLLQTKNPAKAREILTPFAGTEGAGFELYEALGRAAQALGDHQAALAHYQKALALNGNVVEILNSLGECYLGLGDKAQALRAWEKSLEINPNQERIRNLIGELKK